jgi:hypothetical protein
MQDPRKLALQLRRLTLARGAFDQARALCDHSADVPSPSKDLEAALMTGILVTYCRPFTRNDGIGPLPAAFNKFTSHAALQHIHDAALAARNVVYAHRDNIQSAVLAASVFPPEKASYLSLELTADGHTILIYEPAIAFSEVGKFRALIEFQSTRAKKSVTQLVNAIKSHHALGNGRYRISDDIIRDA